MRRRDKIQDIFESNGTEALLIYGEDYLGEEAAMRYVNERGGLVFLICKDMQAASKFQAEASSDTSKWTFIDYVVPGPAAWAKVLEKIAKVLSEKKH